MPRPTRNSVTEYNNVEKPLLEQLAAMGWDTLRDDAGNLVNGDIDVPALTFRERFSEVLLKQHVKAALHKLNVTDEGAPWLDDERLNIALTALERVGRSALMESNVEATRLLLEGVIVPGDPDIHGGRNQTVSFIDYEKPGRNHFFAVNQFRVDPPGAVTAKKFYIPDIVLFVNGIPLVVIECKAPGISTPMNKGIEQLLQYSNQRGYDDPEGVEPLFWYSQVLVSTYYYGARVATVGARYDHYMEWKTVKPRTDEQVIEELNTSPLVSQHKLVAGVLRPDNLIDLVRHFTLFKESEGRKIKIVARYQQWEAVQEAIRRLREEDTRLRDGEFDKRGGIVWHTQGSGKSLTMVFLVRKLRTQPDLRQFKVVVVTDRRDLEDQLSETMTLTGETVRKAQNASALRALLKQDAPGLIFGMIQKYRREVVEEDVEDEVLEDEDLERPIDDDDRFGALNESTNILVLIDEAHRSHTDEWHANMVAALPNSARIGFTGTPILMGKQKRTHEIFGSYIDIYNIQQAEADGVTVPIVYEGREVEAGVLDHSDLDQLFEQNFEQLTSEQREEIKKKYAREKEVLESIDLIKKKAADILKHYVSTVLPNGFKAQLVAVSRLGAIRYQAALSEAHAALVGRLEAMDQDLATLPDDKIREYDEETQYLINALKHLDTIRSLEFAAVISSGQHDDPAWKVWSERSQIDSRIERFKKPLKHDDPARRDGLAFLCVRTMLLTGFDAPIEQALYLDRFIQGHELLQAIARVNRTYKNKQVGYVVDYYGVTNRLTEALAVYSQSDVEGAMKSIAEELPKLQDRHQEVISFFRENGIPDINNMDACVMLLVENERARAEFTQFFKAFLVTLDVVLPRPQALTYVNDAKYFGVISRTVANILREEDDQAVAGVGNKVRQLIDDHIRAYHVEQTIPPLSIMDADYEAQVEKLTSDRAKAAEMEHAAWNEISVKVEEDPVRYERLSERLEGILEELGDHWEALVEALREFIVEMREESPSDRASEFLPERDSYRLKPFMGIIIDAVGADIGTLSNEDLQRYARVTVGMVERIRPEIARKDFWSTPQLRQNLTASLKVYLDDENVIDYEQLDIVVDRVVELAKRRHTELVDA